MINSGLSTLQQDWVFEMDQLGKRRQAFFFVIDFEICLPIICPLRNIDSNTVCFNFRGMRNVPFHNTVPNININLNPLFVSSNKYSDAFSHIQHQQRLGNSFLANLTCPTRIQPDGPDWFGLRKLFNQISAPYLLWMRPSSMLQTVEPSHTEEVLVFSPETFAHINQNRIYTFPMKGTALVRDPVKRSEIERQLLEDAKEKAEHITVVDLLRNDLGRIGSDIRVENFRKISSIHRAHATGQPTEQLLQVSSTISARLPANWHEMIGSIFASILPAGSVSGAPKPRTCQIIRDAEDKITDQIPSSRGYYCGVAGVFNGSSLDSGVLIRFIEMRKNKEYFFRSGSGITVYSDEEKEYEEIKNKISLPVSTVANADINQSG